MELPPSIEGSRHMNDEKLRYLRERGPDQEIEWSMQVFVLPSSKVRSFIDFDSRRECRSALVQDAEDNRKPFDELITNKDIFVGVGNHIRFRMNAKTGEVVKALDALLSSSLGSRIESIPFAQDRLMCPQGDQRDVRVLG